MKKILALVSFLVVAAGCTTEPSVNKEPASNANNTVASKSTAPLSEADITAREKATWEALKKKDYDGFGKMLASDYIEVEDDGVYDKPGILTYLKDLNITDATFSDWKVLSIDKDAVILTYNVNLKATYKGQPIPPGPYRAAAAWVNRDGKWLGFYYQSTEAKTAPPSPTPARSTQPAKATASPAAKPAEAGPDPIANEKIVWDTFKSKNYDAFAALLAPEFVDIESDSVHDKAATVKSVGQFDVSKFELADWKVAKLDDDASLVTFMLKAIGSNADLERHSSIWVNRGGKWLALLHVGTPVAKPAAKPEAKKM
jgi:hypothetical protein